MSATHPTNDQDPRFERALGRGRALWRRIDPGPDLSSKTLADGAAAYGEEPLRNALGLLLHPVECVPRSEHYEAMLLLSGRVAFRPGSYHDWFNLLSWRLWPRSKAALNLRHGLHYLGELSRRMGGDPLRHAGQRVARDPWMQNLANLDEGGCVVTEGLLRRRTVLDDKNVRRFGVAPDEHELLDELCWFGHAALEILRERGPLPRLWLAVVPELSDEALCRRVLTFNPELLPRIAPMLDRLEGLLPAYRDVIRFAEGDPFVKPFQSMDAPWPSR